MKSYLLIDRSGSMEPQWPEVVGGIGTYCKGVDHKVRIRIFDTEHNVIWRGKGKKFSTDEMAKYEPRGMTALYDAMILLDRDVISDDPKKAQIVIMTDGMENASQEGTIVMARKIMKRWEKKGYDVIWLGAEFKDVDAQAVSTGLGTHKTVNVKDAASHSHTMANVATRSMAYASGAVSADDDLGDGIRDAADGKA